MAKAKAAKAKAAKAIVKIKAKAAKAVKQRQTMDQNQNPNQKYNSTAIKSVLIFIMLLTIGLYSYMLNYIFKLESTGCECAKDWRRDYIQYYLMLLIVYVVVQICVLTMGDLAAVIRMNMHLTAIMLVLGILFVVFTLQYVHRLKKIKCKCSEDTARNVLQLVAIIDAVIFSIGALHLIIGLVVFGVIMLTRK
jgi:hypothetical protein